VTADFSCINCHVECVTSIAGLDPERRRPSGLRRSEAGRGSRTARDGMSHPTTVHNNERSVTACAVIILAARSISAWVLRRRTSDPWGGPTVGVDHNLQSA